MVLKKIPGLEEASHSHELHIFICFKIVYLIFPQYRPRFTMRYGIEGGIARELISFGAKVHFTNGKWYGRKTLKSWRVTNPGPEATGFTINAVDCTDSFVNQGAIENMGKEYSHFYFKKGSKMRTKL